MALNAAGAFHIVIDGLAEARRDLAELVQQFPARASQAVNKAAAFGRTRASEQIRLQVNFPARYLVGADGKLTIRPASTGNAEAVIVARDRPTSLARFSATSSLRTARRGGGVNVRVKPGGGKFMQGAFLVRLPQGNTLSDTVFNLGLAIRLKPGEGVRNKKVQVQLSRDVVLLYGPSAAQLFKTVGEDISPAVADFLEAEFLRLSRLN